jgi:glycosyltransferase involved in cell wall biosynthesis
MAQHDEMKAYSEQVGLSNVQWLDWQPREAFPSVMHTADVVLATLKAEVSTPVVPSKILSAMSAGRPVITCMPMTGDAPKLVQDANSGIILAPGDDKALAEAILALYQDDAACTILGKNGRLYVERHLDVRLWAQKYLSLFRHLIAAAHAKDALPPFSPADNMMSGEYE